MVKVREWFPQVFPQQQEDPGDAFIENALETMHFWGLTKKEFDELDIPVYIILRDHAFKKIGEERERMNGLMGKFK